MWDEGDELNSFAGNVPYQYYNRLSKKFYENNGIYQQSMRKRNAADNSYDNLLHS